MVLPSEKGQVVGGAVQRLTRDGVTHEVNAAIEGRPRARAAAWQPHAKPAARHLSVWCTEFKLCFFLNYCS